MTPDVLASVREAVIETDADFRIVRWNRGAEAMYGWSAGEIVGRRMPDVVPTRRRSGERAAQIERLREDGHVMTLVAQQTRAGEEIEVEASVIALRAAGGEITGFVAVSRDVSTRRRLETRLEETRHLELVAQLAGGIAHDLNTLLTAILGYAGLTVADPDLPERLRSDVEQISSAAHRAGMLTGQLLAFSRAQVLAPRVVDLDEIVAASLPARRRVAGKRIELVDEPADGLTLVQSTRRSSSGYCSTSSAMPPTRCPRAAR